MSADTGSGTGVLHGSGVGRGAVVGPVARAHPAPVVRQDAEGPVGAQERDLATAAVREAFAAVAAALSDRADHAAGTIAEVLGDEAAARTRILYGGSVKSGNIAGFMAQKDVDGALVGGASLDAAEFSAIARFRSHVGTV